MDRNRSTRVALIAIAALVGANALQTGGLPAGGWRLGLEIASVRLAVSLERDPVRIRTLLSGIGRSVAALVRD